jgi:hypothetical protein
MATDGLGLGLSLDPRELATDDAQGAHDPQQMEIATAIRHPGPVRRQPLGSPVPAVGPADNVQSIPIVHR